MIIYFNVHVVIYFCDGKAEFSAALTDMLICCAVILIYYWFSILISNNNKLIINWYYYQCWKHLLLLNIFVDICGMFFSVIWWIES